MNLFRGNESGGGRAVQSPDREFRAPQKHGRRGGDAGALYRAVPPDERPLCRDPQASCRF
ncbi:hypothetical protein DPV79_33815 [Burkholderia reimsis]|uniref:Uncharacterized protein n=1 Tax=Burkholderia reimsis TaxID=2234132 RepID=A0A365QJY2_9BURK|nr:hypothetical protein DPV79_33815 [Burkholderia reimsis]